MICNSIRVFFVAALASAPFAMHSNAEAQILFPIGGSARSDGGQVVGISLNSMGQTITSLGFYDHGGDGIAASYQLGLWDSSQTLVRTATVTPSSPLTGDFRYASIAPITLGSISNPEMFTIGVLLPQVMNDTWLDDALLVLAPGFTGAGDGQFSGPSNSLVYPGTYEPSGAYVVVNANGPAPPLVPEPSTFALLTTAAVLSLLNGRRR
jgi:hypothetical protein